MFGVPIINLVELVVGAYLVALGFRWIADPMGGNAQKGGEQLENDKKKDDLENYRIFFKIGGICTVVHGALSIVLTLMM